MLDWARQHGVGFSTVVSLGPNTSVDLAQVLDYLASDGKTHSIVVYMEGISNARRFMSALRAAAHAKPVIVLKAGRKPAGNEAAGIVLAAGEGAEHAERAGIGVDQPGRDHAIRIEAEVLCRFRRQPCDAGGQGQAAKCFH